MTKLIVVVVPPAQPRFINGESIKKIIPRKIWIKPQTRIVAGAGFESLQMHHLFEYEMILDRRLRWYALKYLERVKRIVTINKLGVEDSGHFGL